MANLMAIFNCSHTTLYQRIKTGEFPKPDGYDWPSRPVGKQGRPYWNTATIRERLGSQDELHHHKSAGLAGNQAA